MKKQFEILKRTRMNLLDLCGGLTVEQLNKIPAGFNNNIAWNLCHLVSSQQGLCYTRAGLPMWIDQKYYDRYKPGTKPETEIDQDELTVTNQLLLSAIDQTETDYNNQLFTNYIEWTNRYGIKISTIDDVLAYVIFHEGLHLGYIMSLKKLVEEAI